MKDQPDVDISTFHERGQAALEEFQRTGVRHSASDVVTRLQTKLDIRRKFLALRSILGDELLANLVGLPSVSLGSIKALPPAPASRINLIGQIVWCLKGTYNDEGIKRWFSRLRPQLEGKSPAEQLGDDWHAESTAAQRVLALARALAGLG